MENSPASVRATKELLSKNVNTELDQQIEAAVEQNARMRLTADFREGVAAFLEKRKPKWSRR
jgi:methylglutaconyl-CoA hydratase